MPESMRPKGRDVRSRTQRLWEWWAPPVWVCERGGWGPTMVIDKGLPPAGFRDLLRVAAPYVRWWKLGFGTVALYPPELVRYKVRQGRRAGVEVYVGGTFLELARVRGHFSEALQQLAALEIQWVELSDGTYPLRGEQRERLIRAARGWGFSVISEVGSKEPGSLLQPERAAEQVAADLDAGASYVIIEARDSGRGVGVFDDRGQLCRDRAEALLAALERHRVEASRVIWEAPRPEQQKELLLWLGPQVGLGNVQVPDILTLAAMRAGLRSDTLRRWLPPEAVTPSVDGTGVGG